MDEFLLDRAISGLLCTSCDSIMIQFSPIIFGGFLITGRMNPAILRATPVQRGRSLYFFFKIIWLKIIGNNYLPKL
ncbi:unnamed protein product [Nesidiocoris tenuis]|uniref:Uncharacterized protein n=1 Tax=Nesidiocoris tenuis TaxID=355587 RepID=A0A6H5HMH6_9HEMI|nr:unnamed protein product [Nesidiocoris tenuis]